MNLHDHDNGPDEIEGLREWAKTGGEIARLDDERAALQAEKATVTDEEHEFRLNVRIATINERIEELEDVEEANPEASSSVTTRADVEEIFTRKPWDAPPPRPVKSYERGRWITREGTPRRLRRRSRAAGRPGRRARPRRARCAARTSGRSSARSGDSPSGEPEPSHAALLALLGRQSACIAELTAALDEAVEALEAARRGRQ
jgi:hypothetical protein